MKYKVSLQNPNNYKELPNLFRIQRWVNTCLSNQKESAELNIRVIDKVEMQSLNAKYRNKNKPTNVLSFPFELPKDVEAALPYPMLGDIIICHQVVCDEAIEQHKSLEAHYAHLIVHGILHLLGYDHIREEDAQIMEPLEIKILSQLGFQNPYESDHVTTNSR